MGDDNGSQKPPTRRDILKYGGVATGSGSLSGCAGVFGPDSQSTPASNTTEESTETAT